jgi:hypothetical protein
MIFIGVFIDIIEKYDLGLIGNIKDMGASCCKSELSFGDSFDLIPQELLDEAFNQFELEFNNSPNNNSIC